MMFACAMYPGTTPYINNIRAETQDNVRRLRNHPSIALWNGNNEVLIGWLHWGWQDGKTKNQTELLFEWY
jgi:beta-mannosidase